MKKIAILRDGSNVGLAGMILLVSMMGLIGTSMASDAAPSTEELAAATYKGIETSPVTLADGHWEGPPAVEGSASIPRVDMDLNFRVTGDLDGDGNEESVALLHYNFGGTGVFSYLAVVEHDTNGATQNTATVELGDRVQIRSARVKDGMLIVKTVEAGPGDGACCPGQKRLRIMAMEGGKLLERSNEDRGRLDLADLQDVNWRLVSLGADEPADELVEIDLAFADGTVSGSSGCNSFRANVESGELPGEFSLVSPLMGTRMACEPGVEAIERRFLDLLQKTKRFRFAGGRLQLDWSGTENWGSLGFIAKAD